MTESQVSNAVHSAVSGPVTQIGTVHGDVNLLTGAPVRTRYRLQVKRIAPPELIDREDELAELAEFCTSASGTYAWWRAKAWSGKSALMSTFVLNPPPGVRIVSFFVTARLAGQNDRAAFIDNLMEQLLTLLGETLPPFLTDATREAHLLGLLTDAAEACRDRGEQFVLLVDGLDEDRGVHAESDSYSIAALLPAEPPAGMLVVVAGRPNPPIPSDVPEHHPLRDPAIVRQLKESPHADKIRESMERELKRLLLGSEIEQDLLGLTTAAGGGLTADDLSELTRETRWQVDEYMRTVTGRSFARRDSHYLPGASPDVYLLGHEELQVTAQDMLGPERLAAYRRRLHAWARRHRRDGWQGTVPEYLLRGYFGMLTATGDVGLMVECATDAVRHDRMLALSGSDATALAEIATALDEAAREQSPDLDAMIRLAMHRDRLLDRGGDVPVDLPALWASVGRVNRAETMAASIKNHGRRVEAFLQIVRTTYRNGDADRSRKLFDQAEAEAMTFLDPDERSPAFVRLIQCAAQCGLTDRATALLGIAASAVREHVPNANALTALMRSAFDSGDIGLARQFAETVAQPVARVKALATLAGLTEDLRGELLEQAETTAGQIQEKGERESAHAVVARAAAALGEADRARRLNKKLGNSVVRSEVALSTAQTAAAAGDLGEATRIAEKLSNPVLQVRVWLAIARAAGAEQAAGYLLRARDCARPVMGIRSTTWGSLVRTAAEVGQFDLAEEIAAESGNDHDDIAAQMAIVRAAAKKGDLDRAVRLTRAITEPSGSAQAWLVLARASPDHLDEAETAIAEEPSSTDQVTRWVGLARVAANAGDAERATTYLAHSEAVMRKIVQPAGRYSELMALRRVAARVGDLPRARQLTMSMQPLAITNAMLRLTVDEIATRHGVSAAETFAAGLPDPERSTGLVRLAEVLLERHDIARAERVAGLVTDDREEKRLRVAIAVAATDAGDPDRAVAMLLDHVDHWRDWASADSLMNSLNRAGALDRMLPHLPDGSLKSWINRQVRNSRAVLEYRRIYGETVSASSEKAWLDRIDRHDDEKADAGLRRKLAWAARCVAAHRAGDTAAVKRLLDKVDDPARELPSYLLEPVVHVAIEIGDFDWVVSACRHLEPGEPSRQVLTVALTAAAESGDFDLVHRIAFRGDHDSSNADHIDVVLAEIYVRHGRYEEAEELFRDSGPAEARLRAALAATTRGDHDRALEFARSLPPAARTAALRSIMDGVLADGDLELAVRAAEAFSELSDGVQAFAAVARQAARAGDRAFAKRMLEHAGTPAGQAAVWLAIADGDGELRRRAVANAIRLARWHAVVEHVIGDDKAAFESVFQEFEAVQD
ncbi:hypothetical protein [Lentzea sp. NPDC004782]|uniref:tetratricopeptide repeat protein n=1 Tax=Lentzea sp. NPDC004782 TaxID=3154458 RepID=UPI0033B269F8